MNKIGIRNEQDQDSETEETAKFGSDRRNAYRENSKASRKNIARGKQRRHMDERRAVAQVLSGLNGKVEEGVAANAELQVKVSVADSRNRGFRKVPDEPLGVHLARKKSAK